MHWSNTMMTYFLRFTFVEVTLGKVDINTSKLASYAGRSEDAVNPWATLRNEMCPVRPLQYSGFHMLVETPEFQHGEAVAESIHFVLTNKQYNIRLARKDKKSISDTFTSAGV